MQWFVVALTIIFSVSTVGAATLVPDGTLAAPGLAFTAHPQSGVYRDAVANLYGITEGLTLPGAQVFVTPLAMPVAPTLSVVGSTGSTSYSYAVVATTGSGHTAASPLAMVSNGLSSLSTANYIAITPSAVAGATRYDIYRIAGGATQGKIGSISATFTTPFRDSGLTADGTTAPLANTTGSLVVGNPPGGAVVAGSVNAEAYYINGAPIGVSAISSVFGRVGVVVAQVNDYSFSQLSGSASPAQLPIGTLTAIGAFRAKDCTGLGHVFSLNLDGTVTCTVDSATDANISFTDITTNNVSITKHGFAPKSPNDATKYLDGTGSYSVPVGSGGVSFATPSALVGLSAIAGAATSAIRSDGAPALNQAIVPTWTGQHTFTASIINPLLIGGTGVGSTLTLQSTSGAGTTDKIVLKGGNNGATTIATFTGDGSRLIMKGNTFAAIDINDDTFPGRRLSLNPVWSSGATYFPASLVGVMHVETDNTVAPISIAASARTSDITLNGTSTANLWLFGFGDNSSLPDNAVWNIYAEGQRIVDHNVVYALGEATAVNRINNVPLVNPFTVANFTPGMLQGLQLDCGNGQSISHYAQYSCTGALSVIRNDESGDQVNNRGWAYGIRFAKDALDSTIYNPSHALELAAGTSQQALVWFSDATHVVWQVYSNATDTPVAPYSLRLGNNRAYLSTGLDAIGTARLVFTSAIATGSAGQTLFFSDSTPTDIAALQAYNFDGNYGLNFRAWNGTALVTIASAKGDGSFIIGSGEMSGTLVNGTLRGPQADSVSNNVVGGVTTYTPSRGSGTGGTGSISFQAIASKAASGATLHALSTYMTIGYNHGGALASAGVQANFPSITDTDEATATSGTVASRQSVALAAPAFTARNTGVVITDAATLRVLGAPTASAAVNLPTITNTWSLWATGAIRLDDLKTTGAATGKKVVCVDTTTGKLYASSTGTDCSN